jgi:hypothetical protein
MASRRSEPRAGRETFVVVRGGEEVAQISPAEPDRHVTL